MYRVHTRELSLRHDSLESQVNAALEQNPTWEPMTIEVTNGMCVAWFKEKVLTPARRSPRRGK